jgi:anti-sigma regulatory factor (Ser/Thr protein kinase)
MHPPAGRSMVHAALLYSSGEVVTRQIVPMVNKALDHDHAVLIALDDRKSDMLASHLGPRAERVAFVPVEARFARPATAIDALAKFIDTQLVAGAPSVRSIGEVMLDGSDLDAEWIRYEAAVNDIFSTTPLHATCLYPTTLPEDVLASIARTHPLLGSDTRDVIALSPSYAGAEAGCSHLPTRHLAPDRDAELTLERVADPRRARLAVSDVVSPGARSSTSETLALVVSELVTNSILHGGGVAALSLWLEPTYVVVTVRDNGPGIPDPFAGLRPPALPHRGAGLWVAHHLCDRIAIEHPATGGTAVTVRVDRREN